MRVLLVVPPNNKHLYPIIPLGLIYIGGVLSKNNIEYGFYDLNFYSSPYKSLIKELERFKPDIVGFSIRNIAETRKMNGVYKSIREIVNISRQFSKVILGGAGFSIFPNEIMRWTQADYGILGAGEAAMIQIINNINSIPKGSIISKCDDGFVTSDISEALRRYWDGYGKYFSLSEVAVPIQTTRGCIFNCRYCTYPSLSNYSVQRRPIELIITEICNILKSTKRNSFYFVDSVFNMDIKYTKALLRRIIKSGLNFKWDCCINPKDYDDEMIELMKKSGCNHCEVGIDSFSDKQLRAMDKGFNSDRARNLLGKLEKFSLPYSVSLILGGFGETGKTLLETLSVAESLENAKVNAFIGERIYPQTPLAKTLNKQKSKLYIADGNSIYIEGSVVPLLKSIIQNASPERFTFTGELL